MDGEEGILTTDRAMDMALADGVGTAGTAAGAATDPTRPTTVGTQVMADTQVIQVTTETTAAMEDMAAGEVTVDTGTPMELTEGMDGEDMEVSGDRLSLDPRLSPDDASQNFYI